eukprot:6544229-Prymnesium_polylepis.1
MASHAIDRGARSPHRGRRRPCGGDIRRRTALLSNLRPAQPAPAAAGGRRSLELEPQPASGGCRALARAIPLLAAALRAYGSR